jgi:hypothetical protein
LLGIGEELAAAWCLVRDCKRGAAAAAGYNAGYDAGAVGAAG